jgi:ribulose kinase
MPPELFDQCKFYDLVDALTHMATGSETRSYCSTVCKQGYLPDGVEGNHQGWKDDFFEAIGLGCFKADGYSGLGGINGKVNKIPHEAHKVYSQHWLTKVLEWNLRQCWRPHRNTL